MKLSVAILLSTVSLASAEDAALRDIISIGTRPYYLVEEMKDGELKNALSEIDFRRSDLSFVSSSTNDDRYLPLTSCSGVRQDDHIIQALRLLHRTSR